MLINLPKRGRRQAVERRDPRRDAGGTRAAAAGEARRGTHVPARNGGGDRGPLDRRADSRARVSARRCASRRATGRSSACSTPATPASTPRSGATPSRCCRRFAAPASRRCIFRLVDAERFDAVKATIESDPRLTLEAKREKRFYAEQSEALSKFISYLGTDDLGHLLDRRDHRRDDHDVRERRVAHRRDRHAARARVLAQRDPRGVPRRGAAAGPARRRRGTDRLRCLSE